MSPPKPALPTSDNLCDRCAAARLVEARPCVLRECAVVRDVPGEPIVTCAFYRPRGSLLH